MIGIKVTKPLRDVLTETDIKHKIFDTEKNVFGHRLITTHQITTGADGKASQSFAHNFGYVPLVLVFVGNYSNTRLWVPQQIQTQWNFNEDLEEVFQFYIDNTNITLDAYAHHYETWMGGSDTPVASHVYTFTVYYFYNEMSETV